LSSIVSSNTETILRNSKPFRENLQADLAGVLGLLGGLRCGLYS
jgi:hypothetical protein